MKVKKLLSLLLVLCMMLSLLPVPALAEDGQPEEPHHEHSYAVTQTAEPTCTEQGYTVYSCACGDTYTDYTDALGHSWDEGKLTLAPTTEAEGEITYTCTACGETRTETLAQLPAEEPTEEAQPDANEETPVIDDIQSVGLQSAPVALTANSEGSTPVMTWADLQAAFNAGGSITLQQGISADEEDSALTVPSGVEVALDLNGHTIDRRLTSAVASGNVITVNGTLTITDTSNVQTGTITGANNTDSGGAIINKGVLTVSGGTISGNRAQEAGAVLNAAGSVLTISGGTFENNTASTFGGGAIVNHGTVSMSGGLIQNNTAVKNGGGIWSDGTLTVTNGSFANNTAQADGGAVYITGDGSVSEISGGTITGNTADQSAGAVYMIGGTTTISGGTITGNTAKAHGGALYVAGNSTVLNLFGGTITGNTAADQGGAIVKYQDANTINIQGSPVILNNQAAAGPDIYMRDNSGLLNVTGALSADARIGVTLASGAGTVTFNYGTYNGPDRLACFVPGSSAYAVGADISQEIVLGSPVTVSFDPGPGTGTMQSVQVANNSYYPLPDCGFTPPHHQEFESWTVNGISSFPGMYVTISGDTVVKAEYVKHSSYTRVEAVAPTDTVNGNIEYYICDVCGGYYLYDGSTYTEILASDIVLPYFTVNDNGTYVRVMRYNGADPEITIPDTVPDNYPDETLRGRDITAVDQSAFENNTVITKVVMGDNIRLIRWHAFYNTSNLKEIVIGSGLYTLESDVFNCPALTSFTCTATQPAEGYYPGLEIPNACVFGDCDISNITFYGMHSGAFHYSVWTVGFALGGGKRNYIGLDAHSDPTWTWAADLSSAEATFNCSDCDFAGTLPATVTSEITTQPTQTVTGVRTYTASVTITGVTYTDSKTEVVPVLPYTVMIADDIPHGTVTADREGAYPGETVTLTAVPDENYRFKAWNVTDGNGAPVTVTGDSFLMPASNVTVSAVFEKLYAVNVTGGTTDKDLAAEGESVTITADTPAAGMSFKEWTGADGLSFTSGGPTDAEATFTMPGRAVAVTATYEAVYAVTVTVEFGEGHGDFAAARFGSVEGFTVNGTTLTYSVLSNMTVGKAKEVFSSKADFYPPAVDDGELFTDDLALNPAGYYASLAEVNAERSAWDGQPVPVEGLKFYAQWEKPVGAVTVSVTAPDPGTEVTVSGNEPMRRTDPQASVSVTGNVTLDTASGANWWTDYDGTYYSGTVASGQACYARFYLNANYGYYLMYYGAEGPVVADGVSVTVENDSEADISIQSSYIRICAKVIAGQHAVSVANGTADKAFAIEGESVTITANAPEAGMRFKEWTGVDGLSFTSGGPTDAEATFTMPAKDVTVTASFTMIDYNVTVTPATNGTVTADKEVAHVGDEITLTVTPDEGYELDTLTVTDANGDPVTVENNQFTMPNSDVTVTATFKTAAPVTYTYFVGNSLSLQGDIGVNFYVKLNDVDPADARVVFTWGSGSYAKTEEVSLSSLTAAGNGYYKLTARVAAAQMTDLIHAELYDGDTLVEETDYSVAQYANYVLTGSDEVLLPLVGNDAAKLEKLRGMCKAMLIYGAKAQKQFNYRTDDPADAGLTYTLEEVGALGTTTFPDGFEAACGIKYAGSSLILKTETTYRLFFTVSDQAKLDSLTVTLGDKTLTCVKNGSYVCYEIANIPAAKVLSDYTLTFGDLTVTANAGEYMSKALTGSNETLKDTMTALYWYSKAAQTYFGVQ